MNKEALNNILYPSIEPFHSGMLRVSNLHQIYYEQSGNPNGKPVLFIHGGPGGGTNPMHRRYFNPEIYHIILVDQRGSGKSLPHAEIRENTTQLLIQDFEHIRELLNIKQWLLFGGSWGVTLGLAYAEAYPECVSGLILRGVFLGLQEDLHWMYQHGASEIFPEAWSEYIAIIPENERENMIGAYHKRLFSQDKDIQQQAAVAWSKWEGSISSLFIDGAQIAKFSEANFSLAFASIENHFFTNNLFLRHNQLLEEAYKISNIPTTIVHGRYDICCPIRGAWQLKQALPNASLIVVPDAGHSLTEVGIARELVIATDKFSLL
ncbi:MAG: prolyl aminopeptidase [Gammaproteobacteria bacterium]|nr:prolyl aminopeptidase [Gammaproteobacteria bacterium]